MEYTITEQVVIDDMAAKAATIDEMTGWEVTDTLKYIRQEYERGAISMAAAAIAGEPFVTRTNNKAKEIAKKYNQRAKTIPNNVKFYPSH